MDSSAYRSDIINLEPVGLFEPFSALHLTQKRVEMDVFLVFSPPTDVDFVVENHDPRSLQITINLMMDSAQFSGHPNHRTHRAQSNVRPCLHTASVAIGLLISYHQK